MSRGVIHTGVMRLGLGATIALLLAMSSVAAVTIAADTSTGATAVPTDATLPAASSTPQQVALGVPVTVSGNGFNPNESLSLWQIGPDGSVTPLSGLQTDGSGAFTTTVSFAIAGTWRVTAHSIATGNEFVATYTAATTTAPVTAPVTSPVTSPTTGVVPPITTAPTTTTPQVAVGSPVTFSGTAYTANESISLWETGPNAAVTPLSGINADANGAFSTSVTFPYAGQWQVTAHGVTSGNQTIAAFTVGTGGSTTAAPVGAPAVPQVVIGSPVTFSGTGFYASEAISLWTTDPNRNVLSLSGISADGAGAFSTTVTFSTNGQWSVTAHGITSGKETVGTYTVGAVGTAAGVPAAASTVGTNAPQVVVGSFVSFSGSGFAANEEVALWETGPDATVSPLSGSGSNANGTVSVSVTFPSVGYWQVTGHGKTSGHEVIAGYNVSNTAGAVSAPVTSSAAAPASPGSPGAGNPISTTAGTVVTFAAAGFNGNEVINAWITAPDSTVSPLDTTQANANGQVTISTSFPSAGFWQVTAHGKDSSHEVVGHYQVRAVS